MTKFNYRLLFLLPLFVYACGTLQIEKKRFSSGYYVHWNSKKLSKNEEENSRTNHISSSSLHQKEFTDDTQESEDEQSSTLSFELSDATDETKSVSLDSNEQQENGITKNRRRRHGAKYSRNYTFEQGAKETLNYSQWSLIVFLLFPFVFRINHLGNSTSIWAFKNKTKARWLFAGLTILMFVLSIGFGFLLRIPLNPFTAGLSILGLVMGLIFSLWKNKNSTTRSNRLTAFSFLRIGSMISAVGVGGALANSGFGFIKNWKVGFGLIQQAGDPFENINSTGEIILMVVLGIAILLLLLYLTVVLSCSLSCNGYDFLAVLVALGGVFLAFFLGFFFIFNAFRKVDEPMKRITNKALIAGGAGVFLAVALLLILYGFN